MAETLEWSPERTRLALDAAAQALPDLGLRLVWFGDSAVELLADIDLASPASKLTTRSIEVAGFRRDGARLLWQLAVKAKLARVENPVLEHQLIDAGFVEQETKPPKDQQGHQRGTRVALRLTDRARLDLCLDEDWVLIAGANAFASG